jgi:hypothetical protein
MRRLLPCLILLAAFGCEGSNELVSPRPAPTPAPTPPPTPTPPPSYRIGGRCVTAQSGSTEITATSGGRQWTTYSAGGTYQFVGLPAGEFQVTARVPSWCGRARTRTVTIPPDATVDFLFMCVRAPDDPNSPEK